MFLLEGSPASQPLAQPGTQWGRGWEGIGLVSPFLFMGTGTVFQTKIGPRESWNKILFLSITFFVKSLT